MSDHVSDCERREYWTLIIGYLMERYVHTHDPDTKAEMERLRAEIAEITKLRQNI
jgi:hypothetical protein